MIATTRTNSGQSSWHAGPKVSGERWISGSRLGDNRFVDVSFADLQMQTRSGTLEGGYDRLGLTFSDEARRRVLEWAGGHQRGSRGEHVYDLADYRSDAGAGARVLRRLPRNLRRDRVMESVVRRRRKKLDPDPGVRDALVNAAAEIVRDEGFCRVNIARVLERPG